MACTAGMAGRGMPAAFEIAAVCDDDVAEDEQALTIAAHLDGGVSGTPDRGSYTAPILLAFAQPPGTTVPTSGCKPQAEGALC